MGITYRDEGGASSFESMGFNKNEQLSPLRSTKMTKSGKVMSELEETLMRDEGFRDLLIADEQERPSVEDGLYGNEEDMTQDMPFNTDENELLFSYVNPIQEYRFFSSQLSYATARTQVLLSDEQDWQ